MTLLTNNNRARLYIGFLLNLILKIPIGKKYVIAILVFMLRLKKIISDDVSAPIIKTEK